MKNKPINIYMGIIGEAYVDKETAYAVLLAAKKNILDAKSILDSADMLVTYLNKAIVKADKAITDATEVYNLLKRKANALPRDSYGYAKILDLLHEINLNDFDEDPYNGGNIYTARENKNYADTLYDTIQSIRKEAKDLLEANQLNAIVRCQEYNIAKEVFESMIAEQQVSPEDVSDEAEAALLRFIEETRNNINNVSVISEEISNISTTVKEQAENINEDTTEEANYVLNTTNINWFAGNTAPFEDDGANIEFLESFGLVYNEDDNSFKSNVKDENGKIVDFDDLTIGIPYKADKWLNYSLTQLKRDKQLIAGVDGGKSGKYWYVAVPRYILTNIGEAEYRKTGEHTIKDEWILDNIDNEEYYISLYPCKPTDYEHTDEYHDHPNKNNNNYTKITSKNKYILIENEIYDVFRTDVNKYNRQRLNVYFNLGKPEQESEQETESNTGKYYYLGTEIPSNKSKFTDKGWKNLNSAPFIPENNVLDSQIFYVAIPKNWSIFDGNEKDLINDISEEESNYTFIKSIMLGDTMYNVYITGNPSSRFDDIIDIIDKDNKITIQESDGSDDYKKIIVSDVEDVTWIVGNENFKAVLLKTDNTRVKLKADKGQPNPKLSFEETEFNVESGEDVTLHIKYTEKSVKEYVEIWAYKDGYNFSDKLGFEIKNKSIKPESVTLSDGTIANYNNESGFYEATVNLEETADLYIEDNNNNDESNHCTIVINVEEPTGEPEPEEPTGEPEPTGEEPTSEPEPTGEESLEGTFWYLSNEALTEDNTPHDAVAQDAEDHKGWRELDPDTDRLRIPYVEMEDQNNVNWCIATPASLGFTKIVNNADMDQTNGFTHSNVTVNDVEYDVWTIIRAGWRMNGFYLVKSNNTPFTPEPPEDEEEEQIVISDVNGNEKVRYITSSVDNVEWHLSKDYFRISSAEDDEDPNKIKVKLDIPKPYGKFIFDNTNIEITEGETASFEIRYEEQNIKEEAYIIASKEDYIDSEPLLITLYNISVAPEFITLSNGMTINKDYDDDVYVVNIEPNSDIDITVLNNNETNENTNHCYITVNPAEEPENFKLEWADTSLHISYVGDDISNDFPSLNFYRNDEVIDNPFVNTNKLNIYKDGEQFSYEDMINNKGTYEIYGKAKIDGVSYITGEPLMWKFKEVEVPTNNYWYLSNEALTEDNVPHDVAAQDAEDHKGWRELDPNTEELVIPYVESDKGENWCIATPAALGFTGIINNANIDMTDSFNQDIITVDNVDYIVLTLEIETTRLNGFKLIK